MEKFYRINQTQFQELEHLLRMFTFHKDKLPKICQEETPDIVIGFELGQLYTSLSNDLYSFYQLIEQIDSKDETIHN